MANISLPEFPKLISEFAISRPRPGKNAFYVLTNLKSGKHIRLSSIAYRIAHKLDGHTSMPDLIAQIDGISERAKTEIIALLATHGFIENYQTEQPDQNPPPKPSIESKAMGARHPLFDATGLLLKLNPVVKLIFSMPGFIIWCLIVGAALMSMLNNTDQSSSIVKWLFQLNLIDGIIFTLLVFFAKFFHELGHAAALRTMLLKEGIDPGPIQVGVTRFFFFLLPFTDASASWRVSSLSNRAIIALAGIYFEILLAALAILLATQMTSEIGRAILYQFAFIAGVSTLLFNLNPFIKLDGYHLLSDLLNVQNLQPRSATELNHLFKKITYDVQDTRPVNWIYIAYSVGSMIFRVLIFTGIATAGYLMHPLLGVIVLVLACSVLIVRPIYNLIRQHKDNRFNPIALVILFFMLLMPFVPVQERILVSGIVENNSIQKLILPSGTTVSDDPLGSAVTFENRELDYKIEATKVALSIAKVRYQIAISKRDPNFEQLRDTVVARTNQLERLQAQRDDLQIAKSDLDFIFDSEITFLDQQTIRANSSLGVSLDKAKSQIRLFVPGSKLEKLSNDDKIYPVRYWLKNQPHAYNTQLRVKNWNYTKTLPSPSLARQNDGLILIASDNLQNLVPAHPYFSADTDLSHHHQSGHTLFHGQDVTAVISSGRTILARAVLQSLSDKISVQLEELKKNV